MSSSNTDNGQAPSQQTQQTQQVHHQHPQIQQIMYIQQMMQTQQNLQTQRMQQIQNQQSQQGNAPSRPRRSRRPRSKRPCPFTGCDGNACERHVMIHTVQCKVSGCPLGNPFFVSVETLGAHLINDHNNGDHEYCHWPGCDPNVQRTRSNNMVHIRLHNHRVEDIV